MKRREIANIAAVMTVTSITALAGYEESTHWDSQTRPSNHTKPSSLFGNNVFYSEQIGSLGLSAADACSGASCVDTPTPTPPPTPKPTPTPTPKASATPTPAQTPGQTPAPGTSNTPTPAPGGTTPAPSSGGSGSASGSTAGSGGTAGSASSSGTGQAPSASSGGGGGDTSNQTSDQSGASTTSNGTASTTGAASSGTSSSNQTLVASAVSPATILMSLVVGLIIMLGSWLWIKKRTKSPKLRRSKLLVAITLIGFSITLVWLIIFGLIIY